MDLVKQLAHEAIFPTAGEIIGRASVTSWAIINVMSFLSLADVNMVFTAIVSIVSAVYMSLKAYDMYLSVRERQKKNRKSD